MNKADAKVLCEVVELLRQCPSISPNPYEIVGTVNACKDFQHINRLAATIIDKYTEYSLFKSKIGDENFDGEDYVITAKATYEEKLKELKEYIKIRQAEQWK